MNKNERVQIVRQHFYHDLLTAPDDDPFKQAFLARNPGYLERMKAKIEAAGDKDTESPAYITEVTK